MSRSSPLVDGNIHSYDLGPHQLQVLAAYHLGRERPRYQYGSDHDVRPL